jgi:hypothetical protein
MMSWILYIVLFWLLCLLTLWLWKSSLFKKTWQEPYFADTPVLIESDDWGPGGDFHATRLNKLLDALNQQSDSSGRPAILTADIVLSVPNIQKITETNDGSYFRTDLESFPEIHKTMLAGIQQGTFVPQLHGLDSPLQGHYVDGSTLPTTPITKTDAAKIINTASQTFQQIFAYPSLSTVAPCYLWNDEIEQEWQKQDIQIIQTAGYRCTGRDETGKYIQNPSIIRVGDKNKLGQIYLVRNVMYEPVDGKNTAETAYQEAVAAFKQALPITISTHRYNYTRSADEFERSLTGLNELLVNITQKLPNVRFLSSPELGGLIEIPEQMIVNHFDKATWPSVRILSGSAKLGAFLYRLYYRHPKLVLTSYLTGLIIPAWVISKAKAPRIQGQS